MKALQISAVKTWSRIDIPEPGSPGPGKVLVRVHRMGVCGTDIGCHLGKFPYFDFPRIPGHELGVEVLEVAAGVTGLQHSRNLQPETGGLRSFTHQVVSDWQM